jgi:hypothetical protein
MADDFEDYRLGRITSQLIERDFTRRGFASSEVEQQLYFPRRKERRELCSQFLQDRGIRS